MRRWDTSSNFSPGSMGRLPLRCYFTRTTTNGLQHTNSINVGAGRFRRHIGTSHQASIESLACRPPSEAGRSLVQSWSDARIRSPFSRATYPYQPLEQSRRGTIDWRSEKGYLFEKVSFVLKYVSWAHSFSGHRGLAAMTSIEVVCTEQKQAHLDSPKTSSMKLQQCRIIASFMTKQLDTQTQFSCTAASSPPASISDIRYPTNRYHWGTKVAVSVEFNQARRTS